MVKIKIENIPCREIRRRPLCPYFLENVSEWKKFLCFHGQNQLSSRIAKQAATNIQNISSFIRGQRPNVCFDQDNSG